MKKAADILATILGDQQARQAGEWSAFFGGWRVLAGEDIAAHSRVKDVKRGTVIVEVDHPGWFQMLQMNKGKILTSMKKQYPELKIRDIRIFLGTVERLTAQDSKPGSMPPVRRAAEMEKERALEDTQEHKDFKKMLERLRKGLS